MAEVHQVGESGALSSGHKLPLWQVPVSLILSCARRMKEGNTPKPSRPDPYPIHNWRQGLSDPAFIRDRFDHFLEHAARLGNGIAADADGSLEGPQGHADAISWFAAFINEALRLHPEAVATAFYSEPRGEKVPVPLQGNRTVLVIEETAKNYEGATKHQTGQIPIQTRRI